MKSLNHFILIKSIIFSSGSLSVTCMHTVRKRDYNGGLIISGTMRNSKSMF